ncbi:glycine--tRNA ligase subunit beta [Ottowia beijingensis]|uniref:glycine--tRNA ligase subunit beta n=1 Tax=Ottowia beijingensis TaxID=1207057 RepID=UPI00358DAB67
MTAQNLLVELFVEELPPKALKKLGEAFAGTLFEQLKSQGLTAADSVATPTPRRGGWPCTSRTWRPRRPTRRCRSS